jgi:hypothetical protein
MSIPVNVFINKTEFDFCLIVLKGGYFHAYTQIKDVGNCSGISCGVSGDTSEYVAE